MSLDQTLKHIPRHMLQDPVKNAIVMLHGIDPAGVRIVGETSRTQWNQCRALCPSILNRTPVDLIRASAEARRGVPVAIDGRVKPGHDGSVRECASIRGQRAQL